LLQLAASVATGSAAVCLHWSAARALAAVATKDEIADVMLAIAPVAGLGRIVSAAPAVVTAFEYDIEAALEDPGDHWPLPGRSPPPRPSAHCRRRIGSGLDRSYRP
jgi:hypothetical protein